MEKLGNVPFHANINPLARKILERVASSLVYNEGDQLPYGRIITAMTLWFEDHKKWDEIQKTIRADFAREAQQRRQRDRERER
jgi:hypothetical protein